MNYINYFVDSSSMPDLEDAELSSEDKNIISKAVITIENWNVLADQGVSIAMNSNPDIQYMKNANIEIIQKTSNLKNLTNKLKLKLSSI